MTDRTYVNRTTELDRVQICEGVFLIKTHNEYGYDDKPLSVYEHKNLEVDGVTDIEQLAYLAKALKSLDDDVLYLGFEADDVEEFIKEWAADTAEGAELPFTFTDREGKVQEYTPASLWEASGGCEWEESAQEGYDYGWNI